MNLGSIIKGVLGFFTGGLSKEDYNGNPNNDPESYTDFGGSLDNLGAKISGSRLTNAEKEANAFTASREDLAWNRQLQASNTAYQRQVADMSAAGLNPILAAGAGNGASVPSASTSGSVSPGSANLGSLLQLVSLPAQIKNMNADSREKNAAAADKQESARDKKLHNDFFELTRDLEYQGLQLSNKLSETRISELNQSIEESKKRVDKIAAETRESNQKAYLAVQQAILARANAQNIEFMQPYLAEELRTRAGENEARANVAIVDAAYRQRLIDSGTIEAAVRATNANASESEIKAQVAKVEKLIKDKENKITPDAESQNICERIVAGIRGASKAVLGK